MYKKLWGLSMTSERLRAIYGATGAKAANKAITSFDDHCRQFIEYSSFVMLAKSDGSKLNVPLKGDPAGLVRTDNGKHLLLPGRLGFSSLDG